MLFRAKISGKDKIGVEKILWVRYRKNQTYGHLLGICRGLFSTLFWIVLVYFVVNVKDNLDRYGGMAAYVSIMFFALFATYYIRNFSQQRMMRKFFDSDVIEFNFGDESISVQGQMGIESRLKYRDIESIEEISNMIVFWVSSKQGLHMPISAFANMSEKDALINYVNSKRG